MGVTGISLTPGLEGVSAETPGLADVATLTRLANAFFTALPGATDAPAASGAVPTPVTGSPPMGFRAGLRRLWLLSPHTSSSRQRSEGLPGAARKAS